MLTRMLKLVMFASCILGLLSCDQNIKSAEKKEQPAIKYEEYVASFDRNYDKISSRFYYFIAILPNYSIKEKLSSDHYFDVPDILCRQPDELNLLTLSGKVLKAKKIRLVNEEEKSHYPGTVFEENEYKNQCFYRYETDLPIEVGVAVALPVMFSISDFKVFQYSERQARLDDSSFTKTSPNRKYFYGKERNYITEYYPTAEKFVTSLKEQLPNCLTLESALALKIICVSKESIDDAVNAYCWNSKKLGFYCLDFESGWHAYDKTLHKQFRGPIASLKIEDKYYELGLHSDELSSWFIFDSIDEYVSLNASESVYDDVNLKSKLILSKDIK